MQHIVVQNFLKILQRFLKSVEHDLLLSHLHGLKVLDSSRYQYKTKINRVIQLSVP